MTQWYHCKICGIPVDEFCEDYNPETRVCYPCTRSLFPPTSDEQIRTTPLVKQVKKTWGREDWIANSQLYCSKILYIKQNYGTSIHHHKYKTETMFVLSGKFRMMVEGEIFFIEEGDILNIYPYQVHKIDSIGTNRTEMNRLLEVSTQHFDDDSIRHGTDLTKYLKEVYNYE